MRALVVFVEGQADAWFVLRSLGQVARARFDERKPEDLPTPFGKSPGQGGQSGRGLVLRWNERAVAGRTVQASAEDNEPVFRWWHRSQQIRPRSVALTLFLWFAWVGIEKPPRSCVCYESYV